MAINMIRVKTTRKLFAAMFTLALAAGFVFPAYGVTIKNTIANARDYSGYLLNDFYDNAKPSGLGLKGSYFEDGADNKDDLFWIINPIAETDFFAPENALALKAFSARKRVDNDGTMVDWAKDIETDVLGTAGKLKRQINAPQGYLFSKKQGDLTASPSFTDVRFALAQFMIMEARGEYATTFQDDSVISDLQGMYGAVYNTFRGNFSYSNNPTVPKEMLLWSSCVVREGTSQSFHAADTDPKGHDWSYPLTNVSLWAAIGFARLGIASRSTTADSEGFGKSGNEVQSFGDNCTAVAEASMLYPELYGYDAAYGLYREHWKDNSSKLFYLATQALGILACSRLYQATQKQFYLERADSLIASIAKYFFVGAAGAGVETVDLSVPGTATRAGVIEGYSNALLAMALGDLFQVTNDYDYARLCQDIVAFFNTYMWEAAGEVDGYVEYLNATSLAWIIHPGYASNKTKFITTNSMLLFANEIVIQSNKSFWDLYAFWIIIGAIVAIGVIVVIILINRRGAVGTKLSKRVRGLITEA